MACNCKHSENEIQQGYNNFKELRRMFITRMTVDSKTNDARRRDFNQAIFDFNNDGSTYAVWSEMDMDMILKCFDDAVRDWRSSFCDVKNCNRKVGRYL